MILIFGYSTKFSIRAFCVWQHQCKYVHSASKAMGNEETFGTREIKQNVASFLYTYIEVVHTK